MKDFSYTYLYELYFRVYFEGSRRKLAFPCAQSYCAVTSLSGSYAREGREIEIQERGQPGRPAPAGRNRLQYYHTTQQQRASIAIADRLKKTPKTRSTTNITPSIHAHDVQRQQHISPPQRKQQKQREMSWWPRG